MYRFITYLMQPYPLLLLSLLGVVLYAWRTMQPRRRLLAVASGLLIALAFVSTPAAGHLALGTLEWSYPPTSVEPSRQDTVVVLSGSLYIDDDAGKESRVGPDTFYRCLYAAELYKQAGRCHVIASGGKVDWSRPGPTLAEGMRDFLIQLGVDASDIVVEANSSTTFENARYTAELLANQKTGGRVFLVTEACHMRRAERCFARQGVQVIPAPCDHHALAFERSWTSFVPSADGLLAMQRASHEWLGLMWYWMKGRV